MRKTLNIEPYNFLNNYEQIKEISKDIYLLVENEEIIGSIACYGNEIDDLIVNKKFQHKGYGKQLLLWGIVRLSTIYLWTSDLESIRKRMEHSMKVFMIC